MAVMADSWSSPSQVTVMVLPRVAARVNMPKIDFSQIVSFEGSDETEGAKELACVSGTCEI